MIIVEFKKRKKLLETPLIDILDFDVDDYDVIGSKGFKEDSKSFKSGAIKLFGRTKTDFVLFFPSERDARQLLQSSSENISNSEFPHRTIPTPHWLEKRMLDRMIKNPNKTHVLVPMSNPLEDDYSTPDWALIHDMIGHGLGGNLLSKSTSLFRKFISHIPKYIPDESLDTSDIAREFLRALYSGVPKEFQLGIGDLRDTIKPKTAGTIGWQPFNPDSVGRDDRLPDIIASVFLEDYNINLAYEYLENNNLPLEWKEQINIMIEMIENYVLQSKEDINKPGRTTLFFSW